MDIFPNVKIFASFVIIYFFLIISESSGWVIEYGFVSPYQLSQSRNNPHSSHDVQDSREYEKEYADQDYDDNGSDDVDTFREIEITFVPRSYAYYGRPKQDINIYMSSPKDDHESRKKKPKKKKASEKNLEKEHKKRAHNDEAFADEYKEAAEKEREIAEKHRKLAAKEREENDLEDAEREEALANVHEAIAQQVEQIADVHEMAADEEQELATDENREQTEDDEFEDANDNFEDGEENVKHKLDKRSPLWFSPNSESDEPITPKVAESVTPAEVVPEVTVNTDVTADIPAGSKADITTDVSVDVGRNPNAFETNVGSDVITTSNEASDSWIPWFGSDSSEDDEISGLSPFSMLDYFSSDDSTYSSMMSMFDMFSDPNNSSYMSNAALMLRIVMFFMPATGIVDQIYFSMALSKIMWHAASMYYEGYGHTAIAATVLPELFYASYMSRRDESFISKNILEPGQIVDVSGMDASSFLKYVHGVEFPPLKEEQELKLRSEIENLVSLTYDDNISEELKKSFVDGLLDTTKYLALFNVEGNLQGNYNGVDVTEVFGGMKPIFGKGSAFDKIKKKMNSVLHKIRSVF